MWPLGRGRPLEGFKTAHKSSWLCPSSFSQAAATAQLQASLVSCFLILKVQCWFLPLGVQASLSRHSFPRGQSTQPLMDMKRRKVGMGDIFKTNNILFQAPAFVCRHTFFGREGGFISGRLLPGGGGGGVGTKLKCRVLQTQRSASFAEKY